MKRLLFLLVTLLLSGCTLSVSTDGTKTGTRVSSTFAPTVQDFKEIRNLSR